MLCGVDALHDRGHYPSGIYTVIYEAKGSSSLAKVRIMEATPDAFGSTSLLTRRLLAANQEDEPGRLHPQHSCDHAGL